MSSPHFGFGGSIFTVPCQLPARVFIMSKDFCASDLGASGFCTPELCVSDLCASDCAKVMVESNIRTADSIKRRDFMFILLERFISSLPRIRVIRLACSVAVERLLSASYASELL